ncbi:MAG: alpha/beta fold hydrolase, partial [Verrucomicrobiota bacterium]
MQKTLQLVLIRVSKVLGIGFAGALIALLLLGIFFLNQKPDLKAWHTVHLDEEFTAKSEIESFSEYLALEERLFTQLEEEVLSVTEKEDQHPVSRYYENSLVNPLNETQNWNRSFELPQIAGSVSPKIGVLLIHGLSDSPYSLRSIGEKLHAQGAHVLALRVPGHGTAPSGLVRTKWPDMAAAVELAMKHLHGQVGEVPLYAIGYSNGAALSVRYALSSLDHKALPRLEGLVLISPEIGITPAASLAVWQGRVGSVLGLDKLKWTGVALEYDPYKYSSFPVNAGDLAHRLTAANRELIQKLDAKGALEEFPRVMAFQSTVDATVKPTAVVEDLFFHLPDRGNELVLFGLNRRVGFSPLYKIDPSVYLKALLEEPGRNFVLTGIVSATDSEDTVEVHRYAMGAREPTKEATEMEWPREIYSLSHVALPFSPDDPIYGRK